MVSEACRCDREFVPFYVSRQLYFQAFDRLYKAFREFLQALFTTRRVYPLAYNKWVREQVGRSRGLPELYTQLPRILELRAFKSDDVANRAQLLRTLLDQ